MLGALIAILILIYQFYYGLIPHEHSWQAVKSVGWPYLILLIVRRKTSLPLRELALSNQCGRLLVELARSMLRLTI
jgi:hypothetical protein